MAITRTRDETIIDVTVASGLVVVQLHDKDKHVHHDLTLEESKELRKQLKQAERKAEARGF